MKNKKQIYRMRNKVMALIVVGLWICRMFSLHGARKKFQSVNRSVCSAWLWKINSLPHFKPRIRPINLYVCRNFSAICNSSNNNNNKQCDKGKCMANTMHISFAVAFAATIVATAAAVAASEFRHTVDVKTDIIPVGCKKHVVLYIFIVDELNTITKHWMRF